MDKGFWTHVDMRDTFIEVARWIKTPRYIKIKAFWYNRSVDGKNPFLLTPFPKTYKIMNEDLVNWKKWNGEGHV